MKKVTIVVVDDHLVVREGLKLIFETEDVYEVIGEASNGHDGLKMIADKNPNVVFLDLNMPKMNGIQVLEELNKTEFSGAVIILTTFNEEHLIRQGLSLGAKGYLLKDTTREEMIRTVEAALRGELLLQPEVSKNMFTPKAPENVKSSPLAFEISERERFVLQEAANGCTSKEIAIDMSISERTVKAHLTNIYRKLGVESRSEAVAKGMEAGIIHRSEADVRSSFHLDQ